MIVIAVDDMHCGSTLGLWPPGIANEDGATIALNRFQVWLWDRWGEMLATALALGKAKRAGERVVAVVVGDVIQGAHERDGQLVTADPTIQAEAAYQALKPLREAVDSMYLLHGTGWHGGPASRYARGAADRLDVVCNPDAGSRFWWELYLDLDGHVVHFTHHVGTTALPFYEATAPLRDYYVLRAELARAYGPDAPRVELDVRAHRHRCIYVHKPPQAHILTLPCWQLKGEFSFRVGASSLPDVGYAVLLADDRDLVVRPVVFPLPAVHIERV